MIMTNKLLLKKKKIGLADSISHFYRFLFNLMVSHTFHIHPFLIALKNAVEANFFKNFIASATDWPINTQNFKIFFASRKFINA